MDWNLSTYPLQLITPHYTKTDAKVALHSTKHWLMSFTIKFETTPSVKMNNNKNNPDSKYCQLETIGDPPETNENRQWTFSTTGISCDGVSSR